MYQSQLVALMIGQAPESSTAADGNPLSPLLFLGVFVVIFYLLVLLPQRKQAKTRQAFLAGLKKGDEVVTNGGLFGRIAGITEAVVTLEIADKVRVKVARDAVARQQAGEAAES